MTSQHTDTDYYRRGLLSYGELLASQMRELNDDTRLDAIPRRVSLARQIVRWGQDALVVRDDGVRFERTAQPGCLRCGDCLQKLEADPDAIRAHVCSAWWEV